MRDIAPAIIDQLAAEGLRPFVLVSMDIGDGYYYTDCDVPILYDGQSYEPKGFELSSINYPLGTIVDTCSITLDDLDESLKSEFIGGDPQGSMVAVRLVVLDDDYAIVGPSHITWFNGEIGEWEYGEVSVDITLTNMFARWNNKTQAAHSASCRWKQFGGTECTYSGVESWCDGSYTRCAALGNQDNFGGFRWLPSIEGVDIWWGRVEGEG